jgi:hypothetical protein
VIPGPQQCKDITSFLIPLLDELLELEEGVAHSGVSPEGKRYPFVFQAFVILIFGDIPAITKLLFMKGHNAFSPCHACYIEGCRLESGKAKIFYVPLVHPNQVAEWDCNNLPMRTHAGFLAHAREIDLAPTKTARDALTRHYGIHS